jgi:alkylated DNA repair dioxygenase AlkB
MIVTETNADKTKNLLPKDGVVNYYGKLFTKEQSDLYLTILHKTIDWQNDEIILFGKKITTKRKTAWYGDQSYKYTYSNTTKSALPWTKELAQLKLKIENETGETFNSCLLNLYHNGEEGMSWHCDNEKELKKNGAIASVSFGAERRFILKHKTDNCKTEVILEHGSLLVMKETTQTHWLHKLPPAKKIMTPRINLTFRTITG